MTDVRVPPPDEVIGMVGHELRSPLTSVLGYAQLLGAQELTDEQHRYVDVIERNVRRLMRTIDELLVSAELSIGEHRLAWNQVDLARVAHECGDEFERAARAAGVSLTLMAPEPVPVPGAPELLSQAINSLLGHALRSTPRGGTVTMRVGVRDGSTRDAVIEVADTGAGMRPDELGRLTERLHQADDDGDRRVFGVGLGLPVVQAIVDVHGGALDVGSVLGEGTRVTMTLPTGSPASSSGEGSTPH